MTTSTGTTPARFGLGSLIAEAPLLLVLPDSEAASFGASHSFGIGPVCPSLTVAFPSQLGRNRLIVSNSSLVPN